MGIGNVIGFSDMSKSALKMEIVYIIFQLSEYQLRCLKYKEPLPIHPSQLNVILIFIA
jgi:hypothetical protein